MQRSLPSPYSPPTPPLPPQSPILGTPSAPSIPRLSPMASSPIYTDSAVALSPHLAAGSPAGPVPSSSGTNPLLATRVHPVAAQHASSAAAAAAAAAVGAAPERPLKRRSTSDGADVAPCWGVAPGGYHGYTRHSSFTQMTRGGGLRQSLPGGGSFSAGRSCFTGGAGECGPPGSSPLFRAASERGAGDVCTLDRQRTAPQPRRDSSPLLPLLRMRNGGDMANGEHFRGLCLLGRKRCDCFGA